MSIYYLKHAALSSCIMYFCVLQKYEQSHKMCWEYFSEYKSFLLEPFAIITFLSEKKKQDSTMMHAVMNLI